MSKFNSTVEATYKGRLYEGFFPISRVQIFALYKGQKLPQAWYKGQIFADFTRREW